MGYDRVVEEAAWLGNIYLTHEVRLWDMMWLLRERCCLWLGFKYKINCGGAKTGVFVNGSTVGGGLRSYGGIN